MDVPTLMTLFRGQLAFYWGMSSQVIFPYGSFDHVRSES